MAGKQYLKNERRFSFFPHPKYVGIFTAYAYDNGISMPHAMNNMVSKFFDPMPEAEKVKLRAIYEKMTQEEKIRPQTIKQE